MKTNQLKSIAKNVGLWGGFALLGLLLLFILMEAFLPKQTIQLFQVRTYIARYDTMEPVIHPQDLVFINKVKVEKLEEGDLVTFTADINYDGDTEMVTYYVHDIVLRSDGKYNVFVIAEGASTPFGSIISDRIVGGYAFRIAKMGNLIDFLKSPLGIAAVGVNVLVIVGIVILVKKPQTKKEETIQQEN